VSAALRPALAALRHLVRPADQTAALEPARLAPTGLATLDELLGGGLPRGRMSELRGSRSSGRTALALAALGAATARGEAAALVDVGGALDARRARGAGVDLARLLWVRAGDLRRGVQAADLVLGAGGFGLVVLDLGEGSGAPRGQKRIPDSAWLRLARGAERSNAALLIVASDDEVASSRERNASGTFSTLSLATRAGEARFVGGAHRVLVGRGATVELSRSKRSAPGGRADLLLRLR
jgi:RecA/RadA recombinase